MSIGHLTCVLWSNALWNKFRTICIGREIEQKPEFFVNSFCAFFQIKGNNSRPKIVIMFEIKLGLPFMVSDLLYKFKSINGPCVCALRCLCFCSKTGSVFWVELFCLFFLPRGRVGIQLINSSHFCIWKFDKPYSAVSVK